MTAILGAVTKSDKLKISAPGLDQIDPGPGEVVFIATEELQERHFGAVVGDERTAGQLAQLVSSRVSGVRPALLCAHPLPQEVVKP